MNGLAHVQLIPTLNARDFYRRMINNLSNAHEHSCSHSHLRANSRIMHVPETLIDSAREVRFPKESLKRSAQRDAAQAAVVSFNNYAAIEC